MIFAWLAAASVAWAAPNPTIPGGIKISESVFTIEKKSKGESEDFNFSGQAGSTEVSIRATKLETLSQAKDFSKVEFSSIAHLYSLKRSPNEGQITQVTQCDPQFKANHGEVQSLGGKWRSVSGGANSRKTFGACRREHIAYWARYYNLVLEDSNVVITVRFYTKLEGATLAKIKKIEKEHEDLATKLLYRGRRE